MLLNTAYGKSKVRLVQVHREGGRHDLCDFTVAIRFEGDYDASYTAGDNSGVLPTDTMKNTVYALAAAAPIQSPETFALALAAHFLDRNTKLRRVRVEISAQFWDRLAAAERDAQAFIRRGPEVRTARVAADREHIEVDAGISDMLILKSSRSAFTGFMKDELTTLPETTDRILATSLTASWRYFGGPVKFNDAWSEVREALLYAFARHDSASVQHTLHAMGEAVLQRVAEIERIHLVMPNKHHLPIDLTRLGLENRNEIFVPTDEPHGLIEATIAR